MFLVLLAVSFCFGLLVALASLTYFISYFRKDDENSKPIQLSPCKLQSTGQFIHFASPLDSTRHTINESSINNNGSSFNYPSTLSPFGHGATHQSLEVSLKNVLAQNQRVYIESLVSSGVDLSSVDGTCSMEQRKTSTGRDYFTGIHNTPSLPKCSIIEMDDCRLQNIN